MDNIYTHVTFAHIFYIFAAEGLSLLELRPFTEGRSIPGWETSVQEFEFY